MDKSKIEESLKKLIELAREKETKNFNIKFEIPERVISLMKNELDINVEGYQYQIDIYAIKHIFKEHGDKIKEEKRGQVFVSENEILLIIDILENPDIVINSGKNKLGKETITFIKVIEDKYLVIKEVRTGKKTIALNSMRITKIKRIK